MNDTDTTIVIDNGEVVDLLNDEIEVLQGIQDELDFQHEYIEYQREQMRINNSLSLSILVFVGACLGALIFRHLRK